MVDRWMSLSTTFHCFLLVLTSGSGSSSSDATLRFVPFQLVPVPDIYSVNTHLQVEKESSSSCQFWDCSSQPNVCVLSLIVPSYMQYGFQFFFLSEVHSKESFHFLFALSLISKQHLLSYPHCSFT